MVRLVVERRKKRRPRHFVGKRLQVQARNFRPQLRVECDSRRRPIAEALPVVNRGVGKVVVD